LINPNTGQILTADSDATGGYRFISIAPGNYHLQVDAAGFATTGVDFSIETDQTLAVPVRLTVAAANTTVAVTGEPPVLDTAETRNELTIESQAVDSLPLPGRNMISLVTMAPGVTGLGIVAGGSPGSAADNYSTETQVDTSANGQGSVGNMYIVDDLDVTSAIRAGVLNLTPNPDSIQETSVQVNTYTVDYGRASSVQMAMTTKSGGDRFHGSASDYFNNQMLWTHSEFNGGTSFAPFHSNNMSGTIGGPIIPHHQFFFFFAIEPLREASSTGNSSVSFEDPAFTAWAKANFPNTLGTSLLENYPAKAVNATVSQTAAQAFPGTCGTAATADLPCSTPVFDTGLFNATSFRNGTQWNARIDKDFSKDRLYGNIYRTILSTGGPALRPAFTTASDYWTWAWQGNETHTFSPSTLNEIIGGGMRVEGIQPKTGDFKVPVVNVTGLGTGFGDGFAMGDFIQHNYHWRDVLTHIHGSHTLKAGYEGWFGDDVEEFQGPYDLPTFSFNSMTDLVQDLPNTESGVAYNPVSGQHVEWNWNAAGTTDGVFVEDSWKAHRNLTLNFGLRWDDFGNPYSRSSETAFGNFYLGPGSTLDQQIAQGFVLNHKHALNRAITDVLSPRGGFAWDIAGNSQWVLHGGTGIFHNWPTLANMQEEFRGNPPGPIFPTFYQSNSPTASSPNPVFVLGTSNTPPFGFTYPTLQGTPLDAQGGLTGTTFGIGAIDPNLKSPVTYVYSAQLEHPLTRQFVASVGYAGSRAHNQLSGGGQVYSVSYGVDINSYPGDLVDNFPANFLNATSLKPFRLNPSFGTIEYTQNDRRSTFDSFIADVRGRFAGTGFIDVSYTRSASKDDTQVFPTWTNPGQYFGPSNWDAPNRLSATGNYQFRGLANGQGVIGNITGGWGLSGTIIGQSGYPFTVDNVTAFIPVCNNNPAVACTPGSTLTGDRGGDYNADGDALDYPNISSYSIPRSRQDFLKGVFRNNASQVSAPNLGTEGNEAFNNFRGPGFFETNASLSKTTTVHEDLKLEIRFDFFNLFHNVNLETPDVSMTDSTFGRSTSQYEPRWIQIGANIKF
jgi:carboxypeptidase family protein